MSEKKGVAYLLFPRDFLDFVFTSQKKSNKKKNTESIVNLMKAFGLTICGTAKMK